MNDLTEWEAQAVFRAARIQANRIAREIEELSPSHRDAINEGVGELEEALKRLNSRAVEWIEKLKGARGP